jgi:hypothetical protein
MAQKPLPKECEVHPDHLDSLTNPRRAQAPILNPVTTSATVHGGKQPRARAFLILLAATTLFAACQPNPNPNPAPIPRVPTPTPEPNREPERPEKPQTMSNTSAQVLITDVSRDGV